VAREAAGVQGIVGHWSSSGDNSTLGIRQPFPVCGVAGVQDMPFSEATTIGAAVLAMHSGDSMATINVS